MKTGKQRYAIRRRILVQTAGAEVYEVAAASGAATLIAEGHYTGEAWALATNPADSELFATAGDDATVRVWSVSADKLARKAALDAPVRCLAWAPDGATLLAGLGGNVSGARHPKDGTFVLLDVATLRVRAEGRDSRHWIRCAAFSPTGDAFALGSSDQKVYIYDSATARLRARCLAHNAPVAQLDWSLDGRHVQSDATDGEHLYHLASDGAPVRLPSQLRDAAFDSWTCIYGWPVQGCWPALSGDLDRDRTVDVAAADRARTTPLLANGDTAGTVRLVRYPCAQQARSRACAFHHVGPVARVCFTADDCALITIGRQDRAIVVWNVDATATVARGKQDSDEPPLAK